MFAVEALHVIATSILLNTNMTLRTVLGMRGDIICCLRIIFTLGDPLFDCLARGWCMIVCSTLEAEGALAVLADDTLGEHQEILDSPSDDDITVWSNAISQSWV